MCGHQRAELAPHSPISERPTREMWLGTIDLEVTRQASALLDNHGAGSHISFQHAPAQNVNQTSAANDACQVSPHNERVCFDRHGQLNPRPLFNHYRGCVDLANETGGCCQNDFTLRA